MSIIFFELVPLRARKINKNKPKARSPVQGKQTPDRAPGLCAISLTTRHNYLYGIIFDNVNRICDYFLNQRKDKLCT